MSSFEGFSKPTYTQIPDEVIDVLMPLLSEAEFKVLCYICRRTFGFGKTSDRISLSQLVDGIKTKDGQVLDHGTGMSKSSVRRGVQGLVDKGIITVDKVQTEQGDADVNVYALRFKGGGSMVKLPPSQFDRGVGPRRNHRGSMVRPRVVLRQNPQETVEQETEDKSVKKPQTPEELLARFEEQGELMKRMRSLKRS
jgi:hypothetical protein